jgi:HEAT repeat protein
MDLLADKDNNVRAVAAISLARTGAKSDAVVKRLMKTLDDKDRLVRESGCLALGHLKAQAAVTKIVHIW